MKRYDDESVTSEEKTAMIRALIYQINTLDERVKRFAERNKLSKETCLVFDAAFGDARDLVKQLEGDV